MSELMNQIKSLSTPRPFCTNNNDRLIVDLGRETIKMILTRIDNKNPHTVVFQSVNKVVNRGKPQIPVFTEAFGGKCSRPTPKFVSGKVSYAGGAGS